MKPTYITFEQAKWLKEKGFNVPVYDFFFFNTSEKGYGFSYTKEKINHNNNSNLFYYSRPEQHQVVEWLRVNHGIWIEVHGWTNQPVNKEIWKECYQSFINGDATNVSIFKTPQEAYSAAFDYIRNNNLIN